MVIPRPIMYALGGLLASQLALSVTSTWISISNTARSKQELAAAAETANQQWCSTLRVFRESYKVTPPTTEAGRRIRDGLNSVYDAYHCDQVKEP